MRQPPDGKHHSFVIGWSKYMFMSQCIVGSRDWWEYTPLSKGHWQSICTALTAGIYLPSGLCKETVKESTLCKQVTPVRTASGTTNQIWNYIIYNLWRLPQVPFTTIWRTVQSRHKMVFFLPNSYKRVHYGTSVRVEYTGLFCSKFKVTVISPRAVSNIVLFGLCLNMLKK